MISHSRPAAALVTGSYSKMDLTLARTRWYKFDTVETFVITDADTGDVVSGLSLDSVTDGDATLTTAAENNPPTSTMMR